MANTKSKNYKGVFRDANGKIFYQTELGIDSATGKRIQKKTVRINTVNLLKLQRKLMIKLFAYDTIIILTLKTI